MYQFIYKIVLADTIVEKMVYIDNADPVENNFLIKIEKKNLSTEKTYEENRDVIISKHIKCEKKTIKNKCKLPFI